MAYANWSTTAASNNSPAPDGFPEGMAASDVNNSARQLMADLADLRDDISDGSFFSGALDLSGATLTLDSGVIDTAELADDAVETAKIADEAVTLGKMADLAQGSVIVGGASDRPAALALGDGEIAIGDGTDVTAAALEADIVPYDNSTSGLVATDVRAAIDEIVRGGLLSNREEKSLSGTAVDFTSVPVWARRVTLLFSGVKRSASTALYIQIGDSGGVETTGYAGARFRGTAGNAGTSPATAGFETIAAVDNAANEYAGAITLWLVAGTTWIASGSLGSGATNGVITTTAGVVTLDSALTTVRITANGIATLAGEVTAVYE